MFSVKYYRQTRPELPLSYINQLYPRNFLESDLHKFLRPFISTRYILFTNRYCITGNLITPNNRKTNFFSFICCLCLVIIYGLAVYVEYKNENNLQTLIYVMFIIDHFVYIFTIITNSIMNALQSENHVNLILNIQQLQKSFKLNEINYTGFIFVNWICVLGIHMFYILLSVINLYLGRFSISLGFCFITILVLDLNIIYLIRVNKLLVYSIDSWMSELKRLDGKCWNDNIEDAVGYKQHLVRFNDVVETFLEILDSSIDYGKCIEVPSFCYNCVILLDCLTNVQILIVNSAEKKFIMLTITWTFKVALLLFQLSFGSEKLIKTLKNCNSTFLVLKESTRCPGKRSVYKTLSRASFVASKAISTDSGILTVNASLPLALISVIATYSVVLLQIAFL